MDVLLTLLAEISYIPSYLPKFSKPCPMLLEDEVSWQKLLDSISNFIVSCQGKNGKGTIKPFHINIVDMSLTTSPSDTDIKVCSQNCQFFDIYDISVNLKKKKKTATTEEPSAPALTSRESAQILASNKLKTHHMCQQHKKPSIIQSDGKHYQLMMNEITKWAHLMVCSQFRHILVYPPELNLTDFTPRQHSAKKALAKSQVYNAGLPDWMEKLVGMIFVGNMATNNQVMSLATNPPTIPMPFLHPTFMQPPDTQAPAPAPIHPASPLNYPMVNPWLVSLETHPIQEKKAQKFTCHAESLSANGIDNLEDLLHLTSTELMSIIPNINIGIAKGLLAFAEEDVSSLYEHKQVHLM